MATRIWLEEELTHAYLPAIRKLKDNNRGRLEAQSLLSHLRDNWGTVHGLTSIKQQQGCMDQVRRAIKDALGEDHWILSIIKFTTEEYVSLNDEKQGKVAKRNEEIQQLSNPDAIVVKAVRLLESHKWADLAAALAVLTGRRASELLSSARFTKKTQWSVEVEGLAKRGKDEQGDFKFEIPTLTTADKVVSALAKLRKELPGTEDLDPNEINAKYEKAVADACDEHFSELIPPRAGKTRLYTHAFRAVYATIATFWYCPPEVNDVEFRAAIQGHYQILKTKDAKLQRSLAASRHYADYEISDEEIAKYKGKRKGIKLNIQGTGVETIDMFKKTVTEGVKARRVRRKTSSSVRIWLNDKDRLNHIFNEMGINGEGKQEDRIEQFLDLVEPHLSSICRRKEEPSRATLRETISEVVEPPRNQLEQKLETLTDALTQLTTLMGQGVAAEGGGKQPPKVKTEGDRPTEKKEPKERKNSTKPETIQRINWAIDAILAYNNEADRLQTEKWAITINLLKELGILSVPTIEEVIGEAGSRRAELDEHYRKHQIDPAKQNYNHRGKRKITDIISILGTQETQTRDKD